MKLLQLSIAILFIGFMAGCNGSSTPKEMIVGKWNIKDITSGNPTPMPDSIKSKIVKDGKVEFTKDGKYIISGMDREVKGTYLLADDGKTLTTTREGETKSEKSTVDELTSSKLAVTDETGVKLVCSK